MPKLTFEQENAPFAAHVASLPEGPDKEEGLAELAAIKAREEAESVYKWPEARRWSREDFRAIRNNPTIFGITN